MTHQEPPRVVVFAGSNGSGKTTHAQKILESVNIDIFVNADYIARGLSGKNTESVNFEAGRIMLKRLKELASGNRDFAFESTLSNRYFAKFLQELQAKGYHVYIFYFWLKNSNLAYSRVRKRVKEGGHDIPRDVITRRYHRSVRNFFQLYKPIADIWFFIDNSAEVGQLVASYYGYRDVDEPIVIKKTLWKDISKRIRDRA